MKIEKKDLPDVYINSDHSSIQAQRRYKGMIYSILIVLFLSSVFSGIAGIFGFESSLPFKINGVVIFFSTLGTCAIVFFIKPEKNWYIGRAVSESVKTLTWRFMMRSEPFDNTDEIINKKVFLERVNAIIAESSSENFLPKNISPHGNTITQKMIDVCRLPWIERKDIYLEERIKDQINWYSTTGVKKKKASITFVSLLVFFQVISAIYLFFFSDYIQVINLSEICIFSATAIMSVLELNKYRDLHHAYHLTKKELDRIRNSFAYIQDETELSNFILDAEQAISREHTMWLARRGNLSYMK